MYNYRMKSPERGSFAKMVVGLFIFISLSFGLTYAVNSYSIAQEKAQQTAAVRAAWLGK